MNDEKAIMQKQKELEGNVDIDMLLLSMQLSNLSGSSNTLLNTGYNERRRACYGSGNDETIEVKQQFNVHIEGEYGTGGKPMKQANPYLEVDLVDPTDPILFQGEL